MQARDRHYGNPGLFQIVKCTSCGLMFLNPMPTVAYLSGAYPENYYAYQSVAPKTKKERTLKRIRKILRYLFFYVRDKTGDPKFKEPGSLLDIGCGAGAYLAEMRERGWYVRGVELDSRAAERGRQIGLEIFGGTIETANYLVGSFDYVRSNHSFEHFNNPRKALLEMHRVLKPNGILFIGVPNVESLAARLFGMYWWHLGAPVHTFSYSAATLGKFLTATGFKVERINYNSTFTGLIGSLQIYLNRNNGKRSEDGLIVNNPLLMLIGHWLAKITDFLSLGDCIEIIARPARILEQPSNASVMKI